MSLPRSRVKKVFEVKDGFILVPEVAREEISFLLRRHGEVLFAVNGESPEYKRANSMAYRFEQAKPR